MITNFSWFIRVVFVFVRIHWQAGNKNALLGERESGGSVT
jgi:hypothetical protein